MSVDTAPAQPETSSLRMIATLALAGALAGLMLVFVYQATAPRIAAYKAKVLQEAIHEVLKGPERVETMYLVDGGLRADLPVGLEEKSLDRIYRGFDLEGKMIGYAIVSAEAGFQDLIELIVGYDPQTKSLLGMKVLGSKETPGLGDKIEKDEIFVSQFDGVATPLIGVKAGEGKGTPGEIDMITGATISSKAIIRIIENALNLWTPAMAAEETP